MKVFITKNDSYYESVLRKMTVILYYQCVNKYNNKSLFYLLRNI